MSIEYGYLPIKIDELSTEDMQHVIKLSASAILTLDLNSTIEIISEIMSNMTMKTCAAMYSNPKIFKELSELLNNEEYTGKLEKITEEIFKVSREIRELFEKKEEYSSKDKLTFSILLPAIISASVFTTTLTGCLAFVSSIQNNEFNILKEGLMNR